MEYFKRKYKATIKIIFYILLLMIFAGLNIQDNANIWGWQKQVINVLPSGIYIKDISFPDSLTGYAITANDSDKTNYVLKTTNAGFNWNIIRQINESYKALYRIIFLNSSTGYIGGLFGSFADTRIIDKTTNGGINWIKITFPPLVSAEDLYVLNEDTIWLANSYVGSGGLWRTTNGGLNWLRQYPIDNPSNIYMYNGKIGFAYHYGYTNMSKTTDGGFNWVDINVSGFNQMYFKDSLVGFKSNGTFAKTTNGGLNWQQYNLPDIPGALSISKFIKNFSNFHDTIYLVGSFVVLPGIQIRDLIYKSFNGGTSWGYQIIDTSLSRTGLNFSRFITSKKGWCYSINYGIFTNTGGDSTIFTEIKNSGNNIGYKFHLFQNYPNPFNPVTSIKYKVESSQNIKLVVHDILGKEIAILVNEKQRAGEYEVKFKANSLPSGTYFYSLFLEGTLVETKKMIFLK